LDQVTNDLGRGHSVNLDNVLLVCAVCNPQGTPDDSLGQSYVKLLIAVLDTARHLRAAQPPAQQWLVISPLLEATLDAVVREFGEHLLLADAAWAALHPEQAAANTHWRAQQDAATREQNRLITGAADGYSQPSAGCSPASLEMLDEFGQPFAPPRRTASQQARSANAVLLCTADLFALVCVWLW
jgi:hypothetical protein